MTGIEHASRWAQRVWLGVILIVALALYLAGALPQVDRLHGGDEVNFIETALRMGSGVLQPFGLRHGMGLPILLVVEFGLLYLVQHALGSMQAPIDLAWLYLRDPTIFFLLGRLTVLVSGLGVIVMTWWLGCRLRSPVVGLIAAAWTGWSVLPLTMVMRFKEDLPALFGVLAALGCAAQLAGLAGGRMKPLSLALWAGVWIGAASAFKYTAVLGLAPVLLAVWWSAPSGTGRPSARWRVVAQRSLVVLGGTLAAFVALMPSLLLDRRLLLAGVHDLAFGFAEFHQPIPPTVTRLLWHLPGVVGAPVALLAVVGSAVLLWRHRRLGVFLLAYPVALLVFLSPYLGSPTYLALMVPVVALTAAVGFVTVAAPFLSSPTPARRVCLVGLAGLCLWPSVVDDVRLIALTRRPDTRTLARAWVQANVPSGAHIVVEGARYADMWLGPTLPGRADVLAQELMQVEARGGLGRLAQMRLALAQAHPPAAAFALTKVFTAAPDALDRMRPEYVVTSGYFDLDLFDQESPRRIEAPPCHKPGFLQARLALRDYLARDYIEVARFDPGVRFHEEFPVMYTCDVARLQRVPVVNGWRQRHQGPVVTIYRRKSAPAASLRSSSAG
ncbi:MAG: hypothetical protein HY596_01895 [Candidatus Omnitrophica bacterium]|nr:hypothetical protein [Candidatus Omnitrophota bacterium]